MTKNKYRIVLVEWDEVVDQLNYPEGFDNKGFQKEYSYTEINNKIIQLKYFGTKTTIIALTD